GLNSAISAAICLIAATFSMRDPRPVGENGTAHRRIANCRKTPARRSRRTLHLGGCDLWLSLWLGPPPGPGMGGARGRRATRRIYHRSRRLCDARGRDPCRAAAQEEARRPLRAEFILVIVGFPTQRGDRGLIGVPQGSDPSDPSASKSMM